MIRIHFAQLLHKSKWKTLFRFKPRPIAISIFSEPQSFQLISIFISIYFHGNAIL